MNARFFWLKSDQKTVEEISWDKFRELSQRNWKSKNHVRLAVLHDNGDLWYSHGRDESAYIHGRQLKQVLEAI